jgi:hypothetical protein
LQPEAAEKDSTLSLQGLQISGLGAFEDFASIVPP